jgi:hypothetical protein
MRKLTFLFVIPLLLEACSVGSMLPYEVKVSDDKFNNTKTVYMHNNWLGNTTYAFNLVTETKNDSTTYFLALFYYGQDWIFMKSAIIIADGERIVLENGYSETDVNYGAVFENLYFVLQTPELNKICTSKSVEIKIYGEKSSNEFKLTPTNMQRLLDFYNKYCTQRSFSAADF